MMKIFSLFIFGVLFVCSIYCNDEQEILKYRLQKKVSELRKCREIDEQVAIEEVGKESVRRRVVVCMYEASIAAAFLRSKCVDFKEADFYTEEDEIIAVEYGDALRIHDELLEIEERQGYDEQKILNKKYCVLVHISSECDSESD